MNGDEIASEPSKALCWSVRLWETTPSKRWVVLIVAGVAGAMGYWIFHAMLLALVGFGAIMGSTAEYWLPLHYKLDEKGASVRCGISVTAVNWADVKRVTEGEAGVRLSPLEKETRTAAFRGVFLRYAGNREAVLEYVNNLRGNVA